MPFKLVVVAGAAKTKEIRLRLPAVLGRGRTCSIQLPLPLVSRQHCELYEADGKLFVRDLGSLNGTLVDGQKVGEAEVFPGQTLAVGSLTFRVERAEAPVLAAPAPPRPRPPVTTSPSVPTPGAPATLRAAATQTFVPPAANPVATPATPLALATAATTPPATAASLSTTTPAVAAAPTADASPAVPIENADERMTGHEVGAPLVDEALNDLAPAVEEDVAFEALETFAAEELGAEEASSPAPGASDLLPPAALPQTALPAASIPQAAPMALPAVFPLPGMGVAPLAGPVATPLLPSALPHSALPPGIMPPGVMPANVTPAGVMPPSIAGGPDFSDSPPATPDESPANEDADLANFLKSLGK